MKNRKRVAKTKSGGIILGFKEKFAGHIIPLDSECKFIFWFKVDSKLLQMNEDPLFGIVYIPPEYTSYSSDAVFRQIENEYLNFSVNYSNICLLGDFNSRTAAFDDFILVDEKDKAPEIVNFVENGVTHLDLLNIPRKRVSKDRGKNKFGKLLLEFCKENNFFILNGRLTGDENGNFTCKGSSVVDYCICNVQFLEHFCSLNVIDFCKLFSDAHSPLSLSLISRPSGDNSFLDDNQKYNDDKKS